MLKRLTLENYRCFKKTQITFKELSIIVGKNNAGKSTLIESLRILSLFVEKCEKQNYINKPAWLISNNEELGISISLNALDISKSNIFYMYGELPSVITGELEGDIIFKIFIGEDLNTFCLISQNNKYVESRKFAKRLNTNKINILPQISPLLRVEPIIKFDTVQKNISTYLSSRNFRNQLNYFPDEFQKFKELAEKTWQGLLIGSDSRSIRTQGDLYLFVRDDKFESEIGAMGHGLQMWLQTMWFLSRSDTNSTVILDEPDVYMHADLQRRLIKLIKNNYKQVIVATHSIEIMSEVEPENILPINNSKSKQDYANKAPIVQKIVDEIGSVHNIEIARLFSNSKFLIVEGQREDIKLLSIFQSKIFPNSFEQFDILPKTFVEGWGGWQRVIGSNKVFKENKSTIKVYCIFDSDYHTDIEKDDRLKDAALHEINLHIWSKKEIENYLLVPEAIVRLINKRKLVTNVEEIKNEIDSICEEIKEDVIDCFADEIKKKHSNKEFKTILKEARSYIKDRWDNYKWDLVSGKTVISKLSSNFSAKYGISITKINIAKELELSEINDEITSVISAIESKNDFRLKTDD